MEKDTIIEMARAIGRALQNDDRFVRTQLAQNAADEDPELQDLIGQFNLKRIALNQENTREEKDGEKIRKLDEEIREVYARLMANEHMQAYQAAKQELDQLVNGVATIVTLSAQGQNPDDLQESGCGGDCSGCAGCR
ncbi:MAG TPA: YlbF family regulator [Firmicutes bacterium]|nr:YlbF family regulator [Bacillota bacterium]